jgi:hypothetical protein
MSETGYRRMFFIAALWNLVGGVVIWATTPWLFSTSGLSVPSPPLYYQAWVALILTFGLGYYLIYRDMYRNRDIVLIGAVGKSAFSAVFLYSFIAHPGDAPLYFLVPVVGDLVFVVLFLMFLRFARRKRAAA